MEVYKQTQVYSPPSHRLLWRDRVARPPNLSTTKPVIWVNACQWVRNPFPTIPLWPEVSWGGSMCKSNIAYVARQDGATKRHFTLSLWSMPHLVIVAWRPGLWHGLKEGCQMPRNQNMHRAQDCALPSTSPGPEGQNFCSQSSPIPQPKCSNQMISTFFGNFREVFDAPSCIPRFQKQQNTKDATIQTQGPNTSWRSHLQHPIHPPPSIPCQQKQRG